MSSTRTGVRLPPAYRAMVDAIRADAWRFDNPEEVEGALVSLLSDAPRAYNPFELNVLYEMLLIAPAVRELMRDGSRAVREDDSVTAADVVAGWEEMAGMSPGQSPSEAPEAIMTSPNDIVHLPFQLILSVGALSLGMQGESVAKTLMVWRAQTTAMRRIWPVWSGPEGSQLLIAAALSHHHRRAAKSYLTGIKKDAMPPMLNMACTTVLRMAWLFECEQARSLVYGPVSDRRLPADEADQVRMLRRFAEQQPELRKAPVFVHATGSATAWLHPRDYARLRTPPTDDEQVAAIAVDAMANRHYLHDHLAIIEVDRKPWKWIALAPEHRDRATGMLFLEALVAHERGVFAAEVMMMGDSMETLGMGLVLPFGDHAWRGLPDDQRAKAALPTLPPDSAVTSLIVAAWRDLIVANVREQQYESKVERDEKQARRAARASKRGHVRVVRYLPRMVAARRAEEADRLEHGVTGTMRRAYRVGTFAKRLIDGHKRSLEATEFAEEIGMPLKDWQTVVRPHIRGGTDEEREALLAQDDVRLWRSWAAIDLLMATKELRSDTE